jgi:hypothetical protein
MKVLFQKNIWNEYGYDRLIQSFKDRGGDCKEVHIIPFTDKFENPDDIRGWWPDYIFGSNRMVQLCRTVYGYPTYQSFYPIDDFLGRENYLNQFGDYYQWEYLKERLVHYTFPVFIKPYTEKLFSGMVLDSAEDFDKIQLSTTTENIRNEYIFIAPLRHIIQEARFFCYGKKIITASVYKTNRNKKQFRIDETHDAWSAAQDILDSYFSDRNNHYFGWDNFPYAMDIGLTLGPDDKPMWKIVELNNFNSAGIYECDTDAIASCLKAKIPVSVVDPAPESNGFALLDHSASYEIASPAETINISIEVSNV